MTIGFWGEDVPMPILDIWKPIVFWSYCVPVQDVALIGFCDMWYRFGVVVRDCSTVDRAAMVCKIQEPLS